MSDPPDFSYYRGLVASVIRGRTWICAEDVLVPAAATAASLLERFGAARVLAIGGSRGTGELPDPERVPRLTLGSSGDDLMSVIRNGQAALEAVPEAVLSRVDELDPEGEARVLAGLLGGEGRIAGRRVFGGRPRRWLAIEDKTLVDAICDRAGLARAPSRVVAPDAEAVRRAADEVAAGAGDFVLCGDSREGFNGGAEYVRWIRRDQDLEPALEFLAAHCDLVRVMPLLEGLPCSIHGIVFPDYVAALRPCELLVFRDPEASRFRYAGADTFWNAPESLAAEMRAAARRLGAHLAEAFGYRGVFTLDGVATAAGFRPTEVNARVGAALTMATAGLADFPVVLFNALLVEGEPLDYRGRELEALLSEHLEANRAGKALQLTARKIEEHEQVKGRLRLEEGAWKAALDDEPADFTYTLGPSAMGGVLLGALDPGRTPRGPSAAERTVSALRFVDARHGLGFGGMEAVVPVPVRGDGS